MKNLIKQQEEELRNNEEQIFWKAKTEIKGLDLRNMYDAEFVKNFISKVRKETAEYVCDKMIGEKGSGRVSKYNEIYYEGYNARVDEEKELKQSILQEFK